MTDSKYTDLGTREIHKRHSVMIEGGAYPRAKVMDQWELDRLLMQGEITLHQYQAGEYFMEQATRAGSFVKSPRMDGVPVGGANAPDRFTPGMVSFGRTLKLVTKALSQDHASVLADVIVDNQRAGERLSLLKEALDVVVDRRLSASGRRALRHPLRHLA